MSKRVKCKNSLKFSILQIKLKCNKVSAIMNSASMYLENFS